MASGEIKMVAASASPDDVKGISKSQRSGNHDEEGGSGNGSKAACSAAACGPDTKLYEFKEQLLLLASLVATVTYVAGLNLPGGSWQQDAPEGYPAGDPILRDTHYRRYLAFYYCNGTALAASLVVCLILVLLPKKSKPWAIVLRVVMVLDLLGLMGAYAAGSCRDAFTTAYSSVLALFVFTYIIYAFLSHLWLIYTGKRIGDPKKDKEEEKEHEKEKIDVLMLLATFAVTITYVAGLSPPGGFWSSTRDGHSVSDPVLQDRGSGGRYRVFFVCNTTAFAACLLIIVLLLDKKVTRTISARFLALYGLVAVALLGLVGAYAAGSCRKSDSTVYVVSLIAAVPVCVCLQLAVSNAISWKRPDNMADSVLQCFHKIIDTPTGTSRGTDPHLKSSRYLVLFLATLVVTITYQAGMDPPGGLWQDGHKAGHPVLQTTHPNRYKVFFYSNSAAFVTSLVVIMMLQSRFLLQRHTLEAAMVLDLFGLITAYAAGSTRDVSTSIYIVALAGLVLVYVVVHITITDHDSKPEDDDVGKELDAKRKVLLLLAILAATLTYQAGLTPPGGFWSADDDELGRHAGFPVLLNNYPRRYKVFFYCNAASFMASVTLILLLVNPKLYRPGIRCYALYVCMLVAMSGLMGAYAAGSSRHLKTSIYVLTLVVAVLAFIASHVAIFWVLRRRLGKSSKKSGQHNDNAQKDTSSVDKDMLEYLMLLGILAASVTYQTGLKPPGGLWQDNSDGHAAGDSILRDTNKRRYNAFFYSNSTSFMASVVVIVMLLPSTMLHKLETKLWPMHTAILLDMLGLMVAYAAGSTRKLEESRNVMILIIPVLAYVALYAAASILFPRAKEAPTTPAKSRDDDAKTNAIDTHP